jgi:UrcA family protein
MKTHSLIGCAATAIAAYAALIAPAHAEGRPVTVSIGVSTAGLDPSKPADARTLYIRLKKATDIACGRADDRVGLEPVPYFAGCFEKALGNAVRSINRPQLTLVYLESHTLQQASSHGITAPAQMAAN